MSKVESQVDDAKKLALRCKTLELQLRQSVSKKEHHEVTSKLERQIDSLEKDLDRARAENQKTIALNKQIAGVEGLISSLIKTANAQTKTLDFIEEEASTRGKALTAQGKVLDAVAAKVAQGTVPASVHLQALSKIRDLEEDKRGMVRRFDYNSLEARCAELSRQLGATVPGSDYAALKERFDEATKQIADMVPASDFAALKLKAEELEGAIYTMVPREQFVSSETRVKELESRLAEHVPQSVYDDPVSKVVSLAEAVTGGAVQPEEAKAEAVSEAVEAVAPEPAVQPIEDIQPEAIQAPEPETSTQTIAEPQIEVVEAIAPEPAPVVSDAQPVAESNGVTPRVEAEAAVEVNTEQPILDVTEPSPQADVPPASPVPVAPAEPVPEIREVASQLAEINSQAQEAQGDDATIGEAPAEPAAPVASSAAKDAPDIEATAEQTTSA